MVKGYVLLLIMTIDHMMDGTQSLADPATIACTAGGSGRAYLLRRFAHNRTKGKLMSRWWRGLPARFPKRADGVACWRRRRSSTEP
jgi:hypothetical protein